eukprot:TRINITY_DN9841_c0_g1_i4.p3 TRINITY_DN9841_c0_g1~~TRINITY_DN9841_c0_g1_i4.p3  ORF type:complete len:113 (+),score=20.90 TRINITY_DN9841_c0_g1_i4:42-380(+)
MGPAATTTTTTKTTNTSGLFPCTRIPCPRSSSRFWDLRTKLFAERLASLGAEIATVEFAACRVCSLSMIREELGRMEAVQVARIARADRIQRYRVAVANTAFAASRKAAADA